MSSRPESLPQYEPLFVVQALGLALPRRRGGSATPGLKTALPFLWLGGYGRRTGRKGARGHGNGSEFPWPAVRRMARLQCGSSSPNHADAAKAVAAEHGAISAGAVARSRAVPGVHHAIETQRPVRLGGNDASHSVARSGVAGAVARKIPVWQRLRRIADGSSPTFNLARPWLAATSHALRESGVSGSGPTSQAGSADMASGPAAKTQGQALPAPAQSRCTGEESPAMQRMQACPAGWSGAELAWRLPRGAAAAMFRSARLARGRPSASPAVGGTGIAALRNQIQRRVRPHDLLPQHSVTFAATKPLTSTVRESDRNTGQVRAAAEHDPAGRTRQQRTDGVKRTIASSAPPQLPWPQMPRWQGGVPHGQDTTSIPRTLRDKPAASLHEALDESAPRSAGPSLYAAARGFGLSALASAMERVVERKVADKLHEYGEELRSMAPRTPRAADNQMATVFAIEEAAKRLLRRMETLAQEERFRLGRLR